MDKRENNGLNGQRENNGVKGQKGKFRRADRHRQDFLSWLVFLHIAS